MKIEQIKKMNIKELEEMNDNNLSNEEINALMERLHDLDPYNDIFHLGCANWPNCDIFGCGEH